MTTFDSKDSASGTGWQGVVIALPNKRVRLLLVEIENSEVHNAEAAYIVIAPMSGTPTQIKNHDRAIGIVNGWCCDMRHLKMRIDLEIDEPCSIAGFVHHNTAAVHTLKTLYEVIQ